MRALFVLNGEVAAQSPAACARRNLAYGSALIGAIAPRLDIHKVGQPPPLSLSPLYNHSNKQYSKTFSTNTNFKPFKPTLESTNSISIHFQSSCLAADPLLAPALAAAALRANALA